MKKLHLGLIGAVVVAAVVVSLAIRSRARAEFRQEEAAGQQQDQQLAALTDEHQRLSNLAAEAARAPTNEPAGEVGNLRSQAKRLRAENDKLEKQVEEKRHTRQSPPTQSTAPHSPEYIEELQRLSAGKASDGVKLGVAFAMYAMDHDGRFPPTLDELAPYCGKDDLPLTGTNQFEILFKGSTRDLKVPLSEVVVCRDQQTFRAPSGKLARIYITAAGTVETIESDDNFQAYEAAHVMKP